MCHLEANVLCRRERSTDESLVRSLAASPADSVGMAANNSIIVDELLIN